MNMELLDNLKHKQVVFDSRHRERYPGRNTEKLNNHGSD